MDYSAMLTFLSEGNIKNHVGYMRKLKLRHSILEKSIPEIKGKSTSEIAAMNLKKSLKAEIIPNLVNIKAHETYFRSFTKEPTPCKALKKFYSSEDAFCYELLEAARREDTGFLYIFADRRRGVRIFHSSAMWDAFVREEPILALDLCEHAYFADYGFEREKYLRAMLAHLDLLRLGERIEPAT